MNIVNEPGFNGRKAKAAEEPLAIVGIGCRLPGRVSSPQGFWDFMCAGKNGVVEIPADRWSIEKFYDPTGKRPGTMVTKWAGFIDGVNDFDADFFGISPREAESMDPQQRLLLMTTWEAFEDAGLPAAELRGSRTGVFVGISVNDYGSILRGRTYANDVHAATGNAICIAANRISHRLDFRGPSVATDTACSSSMVAAHLACRSVLNGECDMAVASGVNLMLDPGIFIKFSDANMMSPEGLCQTFDAKANGYVRAEGAGVVLLKRLSKALEDGDRIYAQIRATNVNQDGSTSTITVPNGEAQEAMLRELCVKAGVEPREVDFVEAHGTGTPVGDPIEAHAIGSVFGQCDRDDGGVYVGAVKSQIGHLESGAGIVGLIKAALCVHKGEIPPNSNFSEPNPLIPFEQLGIRLPLKTLPWPQSSRPRMAAVNSFGFGGTNASALVQEAPPVVPVAPASSGKRRWLLPISAASETALKAVAGRLADHLEDLGAKAPALRDLAGTLGFNRSHLTYRAAIAADSRNQLISRLRGLAGPEREDEDGVSAEQLAGVVTGQAVQEPKLMFVFTGQGGQWWAMGRELLDKDPLFRETVEEFDAVFAKLAGWSVVEELRRPERNSRIHATRITQPAIFAVQIGLLARLRAWGVEPEGVLGHSFGEVAAAYATGALSLRDAASCIYHRGRLSEQTEGKGAIAAVGLSVIEARALLDELDEDRIEVAAVNGATMVSLAGEAAAMDRVQVHLEADGEVFFRRIKMNYAPHTFMMEEIKEEFLASTADLQPQAGRLPMISTVTGALIGGQALGAEYWWRNIRHAVLFKNGIDQATRRGFNTFLEIGPHPTLAGLISTCLAESGKPAAVLATLKRKEKDRDSLYRALGGLYVNGIALDWAALGEPEYTRLSLPSYPWELKRFHLLSDVMEDQLLLAPSHPLLGYRVTSAYPAWSNDVSLKHLPYLEDHKLQSAPIFPGACYLEMMFAAAKEVFGEGAVELENVVLSEAMQIPEDDVEQVQTVLDPTRNTISIYSRTRDKGREWVLRASARVSVREIPDPDWEDWRKTGAFDDALHKVKGHKFYDVFKDSALKYGPLFRGLKRVWAKDSEAAATIQLAKELGGDYSSYHLHPTLGDAGLQLPFTLIAQYLDKRGKPIVGGYLPVSYRRVRFYRKPGKRIHARSRMIEPSDNLMRIGIEYQDDKGRPVCEIEDGHFRFVELRSRNQGGAQSTTYYEETWEEQTLAGQADPRHRHWLVFTDGHAAVRELREALTAKGHAWTEVRRGRTYAESEGGFTLDPRDREHFEQMVARLAESEAPPSDVLHFWAPEPAAESGELDAELLMAQQSSSPLALLHLVQALKDCEDLAPRLWAIGAGGQVVPQAFAQADARHPDTLAQLPGQGMIRTILAEVGKLKATMIDLDRSRSKAARAQLAEELLADGDELEVALRGARRFVRRLEHREVSALESKRLAADDLDLGTTYRVTMPAPGIVDTLRAIETDRRAPAQGEVEIAVEAVGLNFRDIMAASGLLPEEAEKGAAWDALGLECAGVVTRVGKGAKGLKKGDRVMTTGKGCLAAHFRVPAEIAFRLPKSVSSVEAATIPSAFVTAYYALITQARLRKGERVLIHLATGGVGLAAIQVARMVGAEIFATAGSEKKRSYLRKLGIKHVMDSRSLDFAEQVMKATGGEGVDVVLNALAGPAIEKGLSCLRPFGRFCEIGKRDVYSDSAIGMRALARNVTVFVIDMANIDAKHAPEIAAINHELLRLFAARKLKPLPTRTYPVSRVAEAFKLMQRAEHIGKVVVTLDEAEPEIERDAGREIRFAEKGGYLITGGLNGLGLAIAEWMSQQGAGGLYLMGRSGASTEEAKKVVARMRRRGTRVRVVRGDVSKFADCEKAVAAAKADRLPLRGVIHGAVVLDDGLIDQLDEARMLRVLGPKMAGAWNLHRAVPNDGLEFFVCFSSVSALLGATGQANYVAANAFLDGLCRWRAAQGLPGQSIMWGVLGGTGVAQRNDALMRYMESKGILPVNIPEALDGLATLLRKKVATAACLKMDWSKLATTEPALRKMPRTKEVVALLAGGQASGGKIRAQLMTLAPAERPALLQSYVAGQIAKVLKVDADKIDPIRQLNELGLDSLTSFELKNRLEGDLGVELPVGKFLQRPTIEGLSLAIVESLDASLSTSGESEAADEDSGERPVMSANTRWFWDLSRDHPEATAVLRDFETSQALELQPRLDLRRLRKAFDALTQQHATLRMAYPAEEDGSPGRLISDVHPIGLETHDAQDLSDKEFRALVGAKASEITDLENGPLFRLIVFHRPDDTDVVLLKIQEMAGDGWSLLLILQEILARYTGIDITELMEGGSSKTYEDFLIWERRKLQSDEGQASLRYWRERLEGRPPRLQLPGSRARKPEGPQNSGDLTFRLSGNLVMDLGSFAKSNGITDYAVLLAGYAALLGRQGGAREVLLHSTAANRAQREFEGVVGFMTNMIAYRVPVDPASSFTALCREAQREVRGALEHQGVPVQQVIQDLAAEDEVYRAVRGRADDKTGLFQFGFSMRHPGNVATDVFDELINDATGETTLEFGSLKVRRFPVDRPSALYDLGLYVQESNGVIYGEARFNSDVYDAATVKRLLGDYEALLRRAVAKPQAAVKTLFARKTAGSEMEPAE